MIEEFGIEEVLPEEVKKINYWYSYFAEVI